MPSVCAIIVQDAVAFVSEDMSIRADLKIVSCRVSAELHKQKQHFGSEFGLW